MNVTAIRQVASEDLGPIEPQLGDLGLEIAYGNALELDKQAAERSDMMVLLGGSIRVSNEADYPFLNDEVAALRSVAVDVFQRWLAKIGLGQ